MKNTFSDFFFILCLSSLTVANAQEYKKYKVGVSFGYGQSTHRNPAVYDANASYNVLILSLEPAYRISGKLTFGLRIEGALELKIKITTSNL